MIYELSHLTVEQFDAFAALPENDDKLFEFVGGEVIEVPSNPYASYISSRVLRRIANHVEEHDLGFVTGEAGGYMVSGERYAPDVGFIHKAKQSQLATEGYNPLPPDLAVEVDFPSTMQSQRMLRIKLSNYLAAGVVVWVVLPETREVEVYAPGQPAHLLAAKDTLDGGEVLPGFSAPVQELFPPETPRE
jgi:Uma2 family endonuclease